MSREHDVCCVASWVGRDADSEQGGGAVEREGTVVPRAPGSSGKGVGMTFFPVPWPGSSASLGVT